MCICVKVGYTRMSSIAGFLLHQFRLINSTLHYNKFYESILFTLWIFSYTILKYYKLLATHHSYKQTTTTAYAYMLQTIFFLSLSYKNNKLQNYNYCKLQTATSYYKFLQLLLIHLIQSRTHVVSAAQQWHGFPRPASSSSHHKFCRSGRCSRGNCWNRLPRDLPGKRTKYILID